MSTSWVPQRTSLSELYARLYTPVRGTETLTQYLALVKKQQDDLKDVGGFVAGTLNGSRRKADAVTGRDIVTLDLDSIPQFETQRVIGMVDGLGCGYCIYSTRKHQPEKPRLRILFPLDRTCTADEYEPIARYMASLIGIAYADPTTFEASRLMFWPSVSADGEYVYCWADKPMLSVDGCLAQYPDWRDVASWPVVPGSDIFPRTSVRQTDPTTKRGLVGAFCRLYDIPAAMDEFLPGVYGPCGEGRYTYLGGSTTGGAVLYDDGKFLYSHHATDPCSNTLVNAFDLVRLHKFGYLDDEQPNHVGKNLPSLKRMLAFVGELDSMREARLREAREDAEAAFSAYRAAQDGSVPADGAEGAQDGAQAAQDGNADMFGGWDCKGLEPADTGKGRFKVNLRSIVLVLQRLPKLHGTVRTNLFNGRMEAAGELPWPRGLNVASWRDEDDANLREVLESVFDARVNENDIQTALRIVASERSYHPIRDYLSGLTWDGTFRLDRLFVDYLGAEDSKYTRLVTRTAFTAAVARVMCPGVKYDTAPVLIGGQGRHKSTILAKMGGTWFSDSLRSFGDKDAMETIQSTWLNEIAEMQALGKTGVTAAKMFMSKTDDFFRPSYGKHATSHPRQCVFFGTTNKRECLEDMTGNRRWYPIDIDVQERTKNVFRDLDGERDQLWAEAMFWFENGGATILPPEIDAIARDVQEAHRARHEWEGKIKDFLNEPIPSNWDEMSAEQRRAFYGGGWLGGTPLVKRSRVCSAEIWRECLGEQDSKIKQADSRLINAILRMLPGWKEGGIAEFGAGYGRQRCFVLA